MELRAENRSGEGGLFCSCSRFRFVLMLSMLGLSMDANGVLEHLGRQGFCDAVMKQNGSEID
jgi:hypothetical protein